MPPATSRHFKNVTKDLTILTDSLNLKLKQSQEQGMIEMLLQQKHQDLERFQDM
jgi:hypothetical protein